MHAADDREEGGAYREAELDGGGAGGEGLVDVLHGLDEVGGAEDEVHIIGLLHRHQIESEL
jgi:hypothetical protein